MPMRVHQVRADWVTPLLRPNSGTLHIRVPTHKNNAIDDPLPHNWKPAISDNV